MSKCKEAKEKGLNEINSVYKPIIEEAALVVNNLNKKGLDAKKFYNPKTDSEINWELLLIELNNQRIEAIKEFKKYIENECYEEYEAFLQVALDKAIEYSTFGLSKVIPKHFTHVDIREILKGNILGNRNSLINKLTDDILDSAGIGKNNDLRIAIVTPGKAARKVLKALGIKW